MTTHALVWNGTIEEGRALIAAIEHHCECRRDRLTGRRSGLGCAAHDLLTTDASLARLLFYRRIADHLTAEEWGEAKLCP